MGSIGGVSFAVMEAVSPVAAQGETLERVERPGADGVDYIKRGTRPEEATVRVMQGYSSAANRDSGKNSWMALQGTRVSYAPTAGDARTVVVTRVRVTREFVAAQQSGLGGVFVAEGEVTMEVATA